VTAAESPSIGLALPNYGPALDPGRLLETARVAEAKGYDSVWTTDHVAVPRDQVAIYGNITEALISLAFVASSTERIGLGVSALVVPQREPLLTLKQVLSLDYLSGGRLMLCVAAGWTEKEFANLGYSLQGRGNRLDRWLNLLEQACSTAPGELVFKQADLEIADAFISPGPVAGPPEVWVAGHSSAAIRRAARHGVWHPVGRTVEEVQDLAASFRKQRSKGRVVLRIGVQLDGQPDPTGRDERGRPAIIGPPEWVAQRLREYLVAGCDGFVVMLEGGPEGLVGRVEAFGEQVRPLLGGLPQKEVVR
jgi:alkanesulfonate monooxygenase SsuD/methylene tetrahydromethanopterin reductase-like flavin-dependent oxidoreductase (luciferase family)